MRAAVLGSPVAHSLSPALHRAAYTALGLDWTYEAVDVSAEALPAFLDGLDPDWAGLSLTMPLKSAVLPLLSEVSELARDLGSVNTVLLGHGVRRGDNTDVAGITASLREAGVHEVGRAVVLGGGATARSALAALAELGERAPTVAVRSEPVQLLATARRLGIEVRVVPLAPAALEGCDLLISTLPRGAADPLAAHVAAVPALLDVVYDPWPTPIAAACRGRVVSGRLMLLHQAAAQVRLMTGRAAPLDVMRGVLKALPR